MTAYLLIRLTVHDKARFLEYAAAARGIAPKYGARYLATGRPAEILEGGEGDRPPPIVLTEWPSSDAIRAFWHSPEYREAVKLREGAADVSAMIFEGEVAEGLQ